MYKSTVNKNLFSIAAIIALIPLSAEATPSICDSDPSNIVQNCGFETGDTSSWTQTGNWSTFYNTVTSNPYSGSYALWDGNYNYEGLAGVSQSLIDTSGTNYQLTFWLMQNSSNTGSDSNGPWQLYTASLNGTTLLTLQSLPATGWTQYSFNFTGTGSDTIAFSGYSNSGQNVLDDVNVHAVSSTVPIPSTLWLLGSGLVGLFRFARHKPT